MGNLELCKMQVTLCMLGKNFSRQHFGIFLSFFLEHMIDTSCKLSSKQTICMKCKILFYRKNNKILSVCRLLTLLIAGKEVNNNLHKVLPHLSFDSAHDKTYNKTCETSKNSDQPVHPQSLIRVFADRVCLLQSPGYSKSNNWESLPYRMDVQANLCRSQGLIVGSVMCWLIYLTELLRLHL